MSIIDLMQVPREGHDLHWLKKMLQFAVELEVSTLPPYLSGLWTINEAKSPVSALIQGITEEEMVHLGLACNMLTAIGGAPSIYRAFSKQGDPLSRPAAGRRAAFTHRASGRP